LYDRVLIGTSDIPIENPDEARCTDEEIEYFLEMTARVFPRIQVRREQIVFRFSGVRPLAHSAAKRTGQITRDHSIEVVGGAWTGLNFPVYSLVGGKWTSYRALAAQATDKALGFLGKTRQRDTRRLPIGGGRGFPADAEGQRRTVEGISAWTGLPLERAQILFERYGTRLEQIASFIVREPDEPLRSLPEYSRREIAFLAEYEKIIHLDDLLLRRSMLAILGRLNHPRLLELSDALGEALGWDGQRREAERARSLAILADRHGVRL